VLLHLAGKVAARARAKDLGGRTVSVKIRNRAFRTVTRSHTAALPINDDRGLFQQARVLFDQWWRESGPQPIRLLGVGLSKLQVLPGQGAEHGVDTVADAVRARFGGDALRPARLVDRREDEGD